MNDEQRNPLCVAPINSWRFKPEEALFISNLKWMLLWMYLNVTKKTFNLNKGFEWHRFLKMDVFDFRLTIRWLFFRIHGPRCSFSTKFINECTTTYQTKPHFTTDKSLNFSRWLFSGFHPCKSTLESVLGVNGVKILEHVLFLGPTPSKS